MPKFEGNKEARKEICKNSFVYKKEEILYISPIVKIGKYEWVYHIHKKGKKRFGDYIMKKNGQWVPPSQHSAYNINKAYDNYGLPKSLLTKLVYLDEVQSAISRLITNR